MHTKAAEYRAGKQELDYYRGYDYKYCHYVYNCCKYSEYGYDYYYDKWDYYDLLCQVLPTSIPLGLWDAVKTLDLT